MAATAHTAESEKTNNLLVKVSGINFAIAII
jgi:hypothetical protein